jgi:hypothetical protein
MSISKKTAGLTALALRDRILTYKERQVIVKEAVKEGSSMQEINSYLDEALTERLKSFSKEELKCCPHCGAQIPLISDVCLFCGVSLESHDSQENATPSVYVSGGAAKIIHDENRRTAAAQKHDQKTCPDCGAPYPLVSNICTHCGHVFHEQKLSDLNVRQLIDNIQQSISELKSVPQPTFWKVLWYRKPMWIFLLSSLFLIITLQYFFRVSFDNDEAFRQYGMQALKTLCISLGLLTVSVVMLRSCKKTDPPSKIADDKFFAALHRKEMYENQISTLYGGNSEARKLLDQYSAQTGLITRERESRQRKLMVVICFFVALNILPVVIMDASYGDIEERFEISEPQPSSFSQNITPDIYRLWDEKHPITVDNNRIAQYVSASPDAELSIDVDYNADCAWFKLRISNIKLASTDMPLNLGGRQMALQLTDKANLPKGSPFDKILLQDGLWFYDDLEKGRGGICAEFISESLRFTPDTASVDGIIQMMQDIQSCSIYITN